MEIREVMSSLLMISKRIEEGAKPGSVEAHDVEVLRMAYSYLQRMYHDKVAEKNLPDSLLLDDLEDLIKKLKKQARPDPAATALLGALNPALKTLTPHIAEAGKKDLATVRRAMARLVELLREGNRHV